MVDSSLRYVYAAAVSYEGLGYPFDSVIKVDVETGAVDRWVCGPRRFVGEPVFCPNPELVASVDTEDSGWVVVMVYDGERCCTELAILDAKCLAAGPVCVLRTVPLPMGFHGSWSDVVVTNSDSIPGGGEAKSPVVDVALPARL